MAQGLKPHRHVCFISDMQTYYDKRKHCTMKKVTYSCYVPNCDFCYSTRSEYRPPPNKDMRKHTS